MLKKLVENIIVYSIFSSIGGLITGAIGDFYYLLLPRRIYIDLAKNDTNMFFRFQIAFGIGFIILFIFIYKIFKAKENGQAYTID